MIQRIFKKKQKAKHQQISYNVHCLCKWSAVHSPNSHHTLLLLLRHSSVDRNPSPNAPSPRTDCIYPPRALSADHSPAPNGPFSRSDGIYPLRPFLLELLHRAHPSSASHSLSPNAPFSRSESTFHSAHRCPHRDSPSRSARPFRSDNTASIRRRALQNRLRRRARHFQWECSRHYVVDCLRRRVD